MASIMQGTTPSIVLSIDTDDFLLQNVTALELYIRNGGKTNTYSLSDVEVDTSENTLTKTFTEAETSAFVPYDGVTVQARFWFSDGSIIGINRISFNVSDMMGVGNDG